LYGIVFIPGFRLCIDHGLQHLWTLSSMLQSGSYLYGMFCLQDGLLCNVSCLGIPSGDLVCPFYGFPSGENEKIILEVHYYQIAGHFDEEK